MKEKTMAMLSNFIASKRTTADTFLAKKMELLFVPASKEAENVHFYESSIFEK